MDGYVHAFAFFGGVPQSVLYDNDRCLVSKIQPDGARVRAYVEQVVIGWRGDVIARHPQCYGREDMVFDPIHYSRCSNARSMLWIRPHPLRSGTCPKSSTRCAA